MQKGDVFVFLTKDEEKRIQCVNDLRYKIHVGTYADVNVSFGGTKIACLTSKTVVTLPVGPVHHLYMYITYKNMHLYRNCMYVNIGYFITYKTGHCHVGDNLEYIESYHNRLDFKWFSMFHKPWP